MDAPVGTVTFLFSDIEGSTRRWQDEPDAMRALLIEHDAIWRDEITTLARAALDTAVRIGMPEVQRDAQALLG